MSIYSYVPVHSRDHNRKDEFLLRVKRTDMHHNRPTFVLLHGWLGDSKDYDLFFDEFEPTHNLIAIEHRGHGESDAPLEELWTTIDLAHDICTILQQYLDGCSNITIIASSLSSAVSLEIAHNHPKLVKKLVLISPAEEFSVPLWMKSITIFPSERILKSILSLLKRMKTDNPEFISGIEKLERSSFDIQKKIIVDTIGTYQLNTDSIQIPIYLIAGEEDHIISLQSSIILNNGLKHSTLIILRGRKHRLLHQDPISIIKIVKLLLNKSKADQLMEKKIHYYNEI